VFTLALADNNLGTSVDVARRDVIEVRIGRGVVAVAPSLTHPPEDQLSHRCLVARPEVVGRGSRQHPPPDGPGDQTRPRISRRALPAPKVLVVLVVGAADAPA
jgi:hypothetical protein